MSRGAAEKKQPLLVVVPASSGDPAASRPAYLLPIAGRPQLGHVLDSAADLAPDDVVVFAHGADRDAGQQIRELAGDLRSVVIGGADPATLVDELLKHLRGQGGDILFISATAGPLDGAFLSEFVEDYRRNPESASRATTVRRDGKRRTSLLITTSAVVDGIRPARADRPADFVDRVFALLDGAVSKSSLREVDPQREGLLGDVTVPRDLARAAAAKRAAVAERLMDAGVVLVDPERTYVHWAVSVGPGTTLYPDTYLEGTTAVGAGCVIEPNVRIIDSSLGDRVLVKMCSAITESVVGPGTQIGPFAHLRPGTRLGRDVKIGNFVEVKKSDIGDGSKASHLSYLGDARIGKLVNVGAGTITCNYDGAKKHVTTIGDGVFIGSDTQFVAPVVVGEDALIGAGTTVTKDVPPNALAVARAKQVNLPDKGVASRKKRTK